MLRGFGSASFKWCSTRPPVAIPLDEMTIAGMRDCVSCFDSALDSMARNRVVQNVHTRRSRSAWARRFGCGSCAFSSYGRLPVALLRLQIGVELVDALGVARERLQRHRAVEEHRQNRDPLLIFEPADPVQQLLDAPDGKGRDDQLAAAFGGRANHRRKAFAVGVVLVHTIAVGGFDQQVVGALDGDGIGQHRPVVAAQVAAKQDRRSADAHARVGGAEEVTGGDEVHLDPGGDRHRPLVADRLEQRHGTEGIGLAVQGQRRLVPREPVAVRVCRVLFLDAPGIGQHDAAQILRAGGAEHTPGKALHDDARQIADVVEVRVRQHDRVERRGGHRQVLPVQLAQLFEPLEHARRR